MSGNSEESATPRPPWGKLPVQQEVAHRRRMLPADCYRTILASICENDSLKAAPRSASAI